MRAYTLKFGRHYEWNIHCMTNEILKPENKYFDFEVNFSASIQMKISWDHYFWRFTGSMWEFGSYNDPTWTRQQSSLL